MAAVVRYDVVAGGGSRGNPGPAGYGAAVLDPATGETLAETARYVGAATNNEAGYRGLIAGLRAAHTLDPAAEIRVRMDSRLVVEQMTGRRQIENPRLRALADEAAAVFPREQVRYEWMPPERNRQADRLANEAMDAGARGEQWDPSASAAAPDGRHGDDNTRAAGSGIPDTRSPDAPAVGWAAPDLGEPATFVLLRHGETVLTPEKRFSGSGGSDPELSAAGRLQAQAAAGAFAARGTIQDIVCSPLRRCRQTAAAVADRLGLPVTVENGLRETDFGAWEGLTFAEVRERHPDDLTAWLTAPEAAPTGGGESFVTVAERVDAARRRLVERHQGRTVLLVTHVTPIKTLVRLALGAPAASMFRMELSAAATSVVAYYADGNASVRLFNDTSYLA